MKKVNEDLMTFLLKELDRIRKMNGQVYEVTLRFKNKKHNSSHYSYGGRE